MKYQRLQRAAFWAFLILMVGSLALYAAFRESLDLNGLRESLRDFGIWAPLAFIIIYILGTIFIPSTPFMSLAGILFGFKYGLIYTVISGFLSSALMFFIARKLGKERVEEILKSRHLKFLTKYNRRLESGGIWNLIILRLVPIMPFNLLNLLMGVSKIKMRAYMIGTVLGLIPSNIVTVYFGNILARFF